MTRTISLTAVFAVAALVLAVPAWSYPDEGERTFLGATQPSTPQYPPDVLERAAAANLRSQSSSPRYSDSASTAIENAVTARELGQREVAIRYSDSVDGALTVGDSPVVTTPVVPTTTSNTQVEWPQIGFGIGLGVLLALGIWLAMRFIRVRPLAHG